MTTVTLSVEADADVVAMLAYGSETFGWAAAEAYVESLDSAFDLLKRHPEIGAVYTNVRPPIRSLTHRRHRIFHDVIDDVILVQRILHVSMDSERHLSG